MKSRMILNLLALLLFLILMVPIGATAQPSFSFGAAGDFAFGKNFKAVAKAVKVQDPDFLIALGDLAYSTVESKWCDYWKNTVKYKDVILIAGNHDSGESKAGNINKYVKFCPFTLDSTRMGDYGKQYYFDYPASGPWRDSFWSYPGLAAPISVSTPITTRAILAMPLQRLRSMMQGRKASSGSSSPCTRTTSV